MQKWLNTDKAEDSREMIDRLLSLVQEGKLKYKYVLLLYVSRGGWIGLYSFCKVKLHLKVLKFLSHYLACQIHMVLTVCRMELVPFDDFSSALDKALGKLGSQPKQVIKF